MCWSNSNRRCQKKLRKKQLWKNLNCWLCPQTGNLSHVWFYQTSDNPCHHYSPAVIASHHMLEKNFLKIGSQSLHVATAVQYHRATIKSQEYFLTKYLRHCVRAVAKFNSKLAQNYCIQRTRLSSLNAKVGFTQQTNVCQFVLANTQELANSCVHTSKYRPIHNYGIHSATTYSESCGVILATVLYSFIPNVIAITSIILCVFLASF